MNKKIKVIELLNLLAENKIKKGTRIKFYSATYKIEYPNLTGIYRENEEMSIKSNLFTSLDIYQLNREVEILEDEEEIDIQGIEELEAIKNINGVSIIDVRDDTINQLIRVVKQLDKKINKED